jgi:circadian clock protein KaiC
MPQRVSTGVFGLDNILDGGLVPGAVYIIQGLPGAGKTILSNQFCFHRVAQGEKVLYVTLLAESHSRLMQHLSGMSFYDESQIPGSVYYVSGFDDLQSAGLQGILKLLNSESTRLQATTIVIDGLFVLEESVASEREFRQFINYLSNLANLLGSTILLLTNSRRGPTSPEFTMVDGWIEIGMMTLDYRSYRYLQVHKFRGSGFVLGRHMALIGNDGMRVLPRLETVTGLAPNNGSDEPPLRSGVAELDTMLHGGLPHGSSTLALGPTGIGKTTLGLQFVGESSAAEPGLIFSFYETPKRICRKGSGLGLNLEQQIADGSVEVLWQSLTDTLLDDIGYRLLGAVRRRGVKRLFVDGIDAIEQASIYPARLAPFLAALANALRDEGVTSIFTSEIPQLVGGEAEIAFGSVSAVAENIMLLRYVEMEASLRRVFSLVKVRESDFDASLRELTITSKGLKLLPLPAPMEGLLTGRAHLQKSTGP